MIPSKIRSGKSIRGFLDGQMLVAMPGMQDERFIRSVVYICAHSDDGAMGLVVNRRAKNLPFHELMVQLKILDDTQAIRLPASADRVQVLNGGPVEKSRGFVLHSTDFFLENSSLPLDEGIALTITVDILKAIARGEGPEQAVVALGYAGWAPGQLEREIQENGWLHCPASSSLIFGRDHEAKYDEAMRSIGIDPRMLVADAGHA